MSLDFDSLRKEITDRFERNIKAHWNKDVEFIIGDLSENFFSISEAEISHPTKEDQRKRFTEYLNNTTFTEYRSLDDPEIGFSENGSIAWGNFKVRVSGVNERDGVKFSFDCAWLWLYRRISDHWVRIGEVSTWK